MKLNSKYFDSIRIGAKRGRTKAKGGPSNEPHPSCQWRDCAKPGNHRAPKGRGKDGEYFHFCVDHVRQYNASYNYFDGMSDADVEAFRKDALTGHRPTWKLGAGEQGPEGAAEAGRPKNGPDNIKDPHEFLAWRAKKAKDAQKEYRRKLKPLERKSLNVMHLPETAGKDDIKARFKELVKQHHPDVNGGDGGSEDKLREIIQAYNYLKQAGLV